MLTAYFDESYNHQTPKTPNDPLVYTVGCWISTVEQWKKFAKKWKSALRSAEIDYFHMKDYETRHGDYEFWTDAKRIGVLKRLHRAIKDHVLHGITVGVNCADYDKTIKPQLRYSFGKTYYGFDVQICLRRISEWCDEQNIHEPIHYVFADLAKQGGDLDSIFRTIAKKPELREAYRCNGMWTKGIMKDVVQLQAADISAYELNKRAVNYLSEGKQFIRRSLQNLRLYRNFDPLYFGETEILNWIKVTSRAEPF